MVKMIQCLFRYAKPGPMMFVQVLRDCCSSEQTASLLFRFGRCFRVVFLDLCYRKIALIFHHALLFEVLDLQSSR